MTAVLPTRLRRLDRAAVQPFLAQLNEWLLPGALYGVQHTWPQLYRSDGDGRFLALFDGERLLAHCAWRLASVRTGQGTQPIALLGSVATDPGERGRGLATRILQQALDDCRAAGAAAVLLWAEREELYLRLGFVATAEERCCAVAAGPQLAAPAGSVRPATIDDHVRLHELHAQNPLGVQRTAREMSALLTTPGLWTWVLEEDGQIAAYACTGKGSDLQGWWHEFGGPDPAVADLLPRAMARQGQPESIALLPPYRSQLPRLLADRCLETATLAGPMVRSLTPGPPPVCWIDGLDSV